MSNSSPPKSNKQKSTWTLLFYIAGDNNLSSFGISDIEEMCEVGSLKGQTHVGVQIDTHGEFEGSLRYEITEPDYTGKAYRTVIKRLPESDSSKPEVLLDFLEWGLNRYPSENTMVVIWGHGTGFHRQPNKNVAYDDGGFSLSIPLLANTLERAQTKTGRKINILGFDACLMSMIEIVDHLRDQADIIVGSQQTEPGDGWPYNKVLQSANKSASASELAHSIVDHYIKHYEKAYYYDGLTQSAVETQFAHSLMKEVSDLAKMIVAEKELMFPLVSRARFYCQEFKMADYIDLGHFLKLLQIDLTEIMKEDRDSQHLSKILVSLKSITPKLISNRRNNSETGIYSKSLNFNDSKATGISIWFPNTESQFKNHFEDYKRLTLKSGNHNYWQEMLTLYFFIYNDIKACRKSHP